LEGLVTRRLLTFAAVLAVLLGLSACTPPIRHGYAYDDTSLPEQSVGVLLGYYGTPSLLISAVDDRTFGITFSQPHPVKIYALPGERIVTLRWTGLSDVSISTNQIITPYSEGKLTINVVAGHTYKFAARQLPAEGILGRKRVQFSVQDMGLDYKGD
jgi:hypothetical protein